MSEHPIDAPSYKPTLFKAIAKTEEDKTRVREALKGLQWYSVSPAPPLLDDPIDLTSSDKTIDYANIQVYESANTNVKPECIALIVLLAIVLMVTFMNVMHNPIVQKRFDSPNGFYSSRK